MKIYCAGPMTLGPMEENIKKAVAAADVLMARGHHPFLPQTCFLWSLVSSVQRSWEEWMAYDKEWLLSCRAIVRLEGASKGADQEMEWAREHGLIVYYSLDQVPHADYAVRYGYTLAITATILREAFGDRPDLVERSNEVAGDMRDRDLPSADVARAVRKALRTYRAEVGHAGTFDDFVARRAELVGAE